MTPGSPSARFARAVFRASTRLLPGAFRREFGEELSDAFTVRAEDAFAAGGARAVAGLLVRTLWDTVVTASTRRSWLVADAGRTTVETNGMGGGEMLHSMMRDFAVGLRMLARRPTYTLVAIGTLALGIGANAAIFSVVNGVLLQPLPYPEPDELVRVYHVDERSGNDRGTFSVPDREDRVGRSDVIDRIAVYSTLPSGPLLTGGDEAIELSVAYVSGGFFGVLDRDAYIGRPLRDDEEYGDNRVVVLSHGFWQRRYGGDESIVGSTIPLDDEGFLVTGVMPPDFTFPSPDVEAWVFLSTIDPGSIPLHIREVRFLDAVARVADGVTLEQATQGMSALASALAEQLPDDNEGLTATALVPLQDSMTGGVRATLVLLLVAVGMVLLIACANVANLLLSRGVERGRELGIRTALGAGRSRLVGQLLSESALLSVGGGLLGVGLAYLGTEVLLGRSQGLLPRAGEVGMDGAVLLFAVVVTVGTAFAFGLLPALQLTKGARTDRLASARRGGGGAGSNRTWGALVAGQVSLAMLVVLATGLVLRSLWALQAVDVGVDAERLVGLSLTINDARYPERPDYLGAYERIMTEIERLPDVESVASLRYLPLRRGGESVRFDILGRPEGGGERPNASLLQVSEGFFETAGTPLVAGREIGSRDAADGPPVVVINEALRRRYWPGESPVGQMVTDVFREPAEIVGVVGDIRQEGLAEDPAPMMYVSQYQLPRRGMAYLIRTAGDPADLVAPVRQAVAAADPDQPIEELAPMTDVVRSASATPRFFSALLASFAVLALLLASFGIYGVVNHSVSRRVAEIGIRVALGAPRNGVRRMIVLGGMRPVLIGAAIGLALSFVAMRAMRSLLYGVGSIDPVTYTAVPVLLVGVALAACWVPATRALRIDPTDALRAE